MKEKDLIQNLFRTEYSKIVVVITRLYGLDRMELAEDVASETFLSALDSWPYRGKPANPTAWLYTVAKNKLKNRIARDNSFNKNILPRLNEKTFEESDIDFSLKNITDSQLQMFFAICHPSISTESHICLALRILCGLGLDEIADAFLTNKETIHKRLQRAKNKLRSEEIKIEMPENDAILSRLSAVNRTIYLLFSEGYYSESNNSVIRKELCIEALNLAYLLLNNPSTNNHETNALISLMCFNASRLEARQSANGNMILYDDQDRKHWDTEFIEKGFHYLQQASRWEITSTYYIEASIAYWHTVENSNAEKWPNILKLYDVMVIAQNTSIIALNRIWAFSKVHGNESAIVELEKLNFTDNHFYFILLAELNKIIDRNKALNYLKIALQLCKTETEKEIIAQRIGDLK